MLFVWKYMLFGRSVRWELITFIEFYSCSKSRITKTYQFQRLAHCIGQVQLVADKSIT